MRAKNVNNRFFKLILYSYAFFSDFFVVFAIDKLIYKSNGLNLKQIAAIVSIWGGVQLLVEIPSGILADRWNRKYMLMLGGLFSAIGYFLWLIFPSFLGYLMGFAVFYAIGEAFISGTDQAYIYDYLSVNKKTDDFEKIYGRFKSIQMTGVAFAWLFGGILSDVFSYDFVIILAVMNGVLVFLIGSLFPKLPQAHPVEEQNSFLFFKSALKYALNHSKIFNVFLWSMIVGSSYRLIDEYWAVYYNWFGFSNTLLGTLVFASAVLSSIFGIFAHRLKKNPLKSINFITIFFIAIVIAAGVFKSLIIIPFVMLLEGLIHLIGILSDSVIQRNVPEDKRSTIASKNQFLKNGFLITGLFFGWIIDLYSVQQGYLFVGLFCLVYFILKFFLRKRLA